MAFAYSSSPYFGIFKATYTNKIYLSSDKINVHNCYGAGVLQTSGASGATVNITRIFK